MCHIVVEVEKSQDLRLATWRPKNADGIVSFQVKVLRTRKANGLSSSLSLKVGEDRYLSLRKVRHKEHIVSTLPFFFFFLFSPSMDWTRATTLERAICFTQFID